MRINAKESGVRGKLRNLDTGEILCAREFDLETGDFEAFQTWPNGEIVWRDGKPVRYKGKARLSFEPTKNLSLPKAEQPQQRYEAIAVPLTWGQCQYQQGHSRCRRSATWMVADEEPLPPVIGDNGQRFAQAKTVGKRFYCDWHYKPPRILDDKGEIVQEMEEIKVRPT